MPPRTRQEILEKLASSVEKALTTALPDKVTRNGAVLSPYFTTRLKTLLEELNGQGDKAVHN